MTIGDGVDDVYPSFLRRRRRRRRGTYSPWLPRCVVTYVSIARERFRRFRRARASLCRSRTRVFNSVSFVKMTRLRFVTRRFGRDSRKRRHSDFGPDRVSRGVRRRVTVCPSVRLSGPPVRAKCSFVVVKSRRRRRRRRFVFVALINNQSSHEWRCWRR
jgi:hypothetical protein